MTHLVKQLRLTIACCCAAGVLLLPAAVQGNFGRQWHGDPVTEPRGLKEVAITREDLVVDLRPLNTLEPAEVRVTYHLHNPGQPRKLDLLFVSGTAVVNDFEVRLGGRLVNSRLLPEDEYHRYVKKLPASWKPPHFMPGIDRKRTYLWFRDDPSDVALVAVSIDLPAGDSTLSAHYWARACGIDEGYPTATWQFPYVLAPAREWASFGRLNVTVYIPEGWESACTPALQREGTVLSEQFDGLPADILHLALRRPAGLAFHLARCLSWGVFVIVVLGGGVFCWLAGRWQGPLLALWFRKWILVAPFLAMSLGTLLGVFWAVGIFLAGAFGLQSTTALLAGQESPHPGGAAIPESLMAPLFIAFVALPTGISITMLAARRRFRPAKR
jgi:hypothetical protein